MCPKFRVMPFNSCPVCKRRAELSLLGYKAVCRRCNIDLAEAPAMKIPQVLTIIVGFIVMVIFQRRGTDEILAQNPPDPVWPLFTYYLTLFALTSIGVAAINYIIRNYFAVYEPPKNT